MIRRRSMAQPAWARVLTYAILALWSAICLLPIAWLAFTSLKLEDDITNGPAYLPFLDFQPSLRAWAFIFAGAEDNLLPRLLNSAAIAVSATALALVSGALAIYAVTRCTPSAFRGAASRGRWIMAAILATRIVPPATAALPLYMMAYHANLLDTRSILVLVYAAANLPVAVWLLQPVMGLSATEQEESAQIDGAPHLVILYSVLLPMLAPGIAAVGLFIFVLCWNEYLLAAYLAADHAMTLPPWIIGQMSYKEAQTGSDAEEWANFSAATVLMALPLMAAAGLVQKALSRAALWRSGV